MKSSFHLSRLARSLVAVGALLPLAGCGAGIHTFESTSIAPIAGEDLARPCTYDIEMPSGNEQGVIPSVKGVFVVFDRPPLDTGTVFNNDGIRSATQTAGFAVMLAHQCNAKTFADLQPEAAKGPGRTLFAALDHFAVSLKHPELSTAKVLVYGFSSSAYLGATLMNYAPDRVIGAVLYAPAAATSNLDGVPVTPGAAQIPALILGNAQDNLAGTTRPMRLYQRGIAAGAPWAFGLTNGIGHCCNYASVDIDAAFIAAIGSGSTAKAAVASAPGALQAGVTARSNFACNFDGVWDALGLPNCSIVSPALGMPAPNQQRSINYFPDQNTAEKWLAFVQKVW